MIPHQYRRRARLWWRGLSEADRILTETTPEEKDLLFALARRHAGGVAVEIGSALGASSCFIAAGIRPGGGVLHCVDSWMVEYRRDGDAIVNYLYRSDRTRVTYAWDDANERILYRLPEASSQECPTQAAFMRNTHAFADVIRPLRRTSAAAAGQFHEGLDFLFVDGWHEYESVSSDARLWVPKVRAGGVVVFHDSGWAVGVQRAIKEYVIPRSEEHHYLENIFWSVVR